MNPTSAARPLLRLAIPATGIRYADRKSSEKRRSDDKLLTEFKKELLRLADMIAPLHAVRCDHAPLSLAVDTERR